MQNGIKRIISDMISKEGKNILIDRNKFFALLTDLAPDYNEERKILNRVLTVETMELICKAMGSTEDSIGEQITDIAQYLIDELGLNEKWVWFSLECFFDEATNNINQVELFNSISKDKVTFESVRLDDKKSSYVSDVKKESKYKIKKEEDIKNRRKFFISTIVCVLLVIVVGVVAAVWVINKPQREIDNKAEQMYLRAQEFIESGDYDSALETVDNIDSQWSDYYQVDYLRTKAEKGQFNETIAEYETEGNYEAVIKYIDENVEDVSADKEIEEIYNNSVSKYKEAAIDKADEYLSSKNYSAAVSVLTTATRLVGSDKRIDEKLIECNKAEILNQITIYKNEENYEEAIEYINENLDVISNDSNILIELSECEDAYRNDIISQAETAFQNDGYEKALEIINEGLDVLSDDSKLLDKKSTYKMYAPVDLTTLENYAGGGVDRFEGREDTLGNYYKTGFETIDTNSPSIVFDIGKKYNLFKAVGFVQNRDKGHSGGARIKIYGDGELLFVKDVTSDMKPFDIEIDITGVQDLSIEMKGGFNGWDWMAASIGDVILQKVK